MRPVFLMDEENKKRLPKRNAWYNREMNVIRIIKCREYKMQLELEE